MKVTAQARRLVTAREQLSVADAMAYHEVIIGAPGHGQTRGWRLRMRGIDGEVGLPGDVDTAAEPAIAYVNEGRWLADCPTTGCAGAMLLLEDAPFMCGACFNAAAGYRYRPVEWPARSDHQAIEAILVERPAPQTRNWTGRARAAWGKAEGETIEDLIAENERHAVRVPRLSGREALSRVLTDEAQPSPDEVSEILSREAL